MQIYETVLVLDPKLSDTEAAEFSEKTKKFIAKEGGDVLGEDKWGRRKLAYPIRHAREGTYLYFKFSASGALANRLSGHLRILEPVLRAMTVQCSPTKPAKAAKTS